MTFDVAWLASPRRSEGGQAALLVRWGAMDAGRGGRAKLTAERPGGQHVRRKMRVRLRAKLRLYEKFKRRCKQEE